MEVPGFSWEESDKLTRHITKPDKNHPGEAIDEWAAVLPFNVTPVRALREGENIEVIEADITFVNGRMRQVQFPASAISHNRPATLIAAETGIHITHREATDLVDFLEVIVSEQSSGIPEDEVLTIASWDADELRVPGAMEVSPRKAFSELAKYGAVKGDEASAKEAWREVLHYASLPGNEKLLLVLGMPLGSLYAARLRHAPYSMGTGTFALHLTGDSAKGKTQAAIAAMMTLGDATEKATTANLYRTWDMSAQAPVALAHRLGILPLFFDEAATSQRSPEEFTQSLFALAQGTERQRATVTGDVDEVDRWECCILSTGEMRLTSKSGLVGVRRRIQELYAPFAPQDHSDQVFTRASAYHGWPLRWIAQDPQVAEAAHLLREVEHSFDDQITWLNAAALNLSVCGLGALMLARVLDSDHVRPATVQAAVQNVVEKLGRAALEEGLDAGHKLAKAVRDAMVMRPNNFQAQDLAMGNARDREGILLEDGAVAIVSSQALARIAKDAGLPDYQAGVRMLVKSGGVQSGGDGRDQRYVTFKSPDGKTERKRMYVFTPVEERDE